MKYVKDNRRCKLTFDNGTVSGGIMFLKRFDPKTSVLTATLNKLEYKYVDCEVYRRAPEGTSEDEMYKYKLYIDVPEDGLTYLLDSSGYVIDRYPLNINK